MQVTQNTIYTTKVIFYFIHLDLDFCLSLGEWAFPFHDTHNDYNLRTRVIPVGTNQGDRPEPHALGGPMDSALQAPLQPPRDAATARQWLATTLPPPLCQLWLLATGPCTG